MLWKHASSLFFNFARWLPRHDEYLSWPWRPRTWNRRSPRGIANRRRRTKDAPGRWPIAVADPPPREILAPKGGGVRARNNGLPALRRGDAPRRQRQLEAARRDPDTPSSHRRTSSRICLVSARTPSLARRLENWSEEQVLRRTRSHAIASNI